jgi:hypothetical protein
MSEKIKAQLSKLRAANDKLTTKVGTNDNRIRSLVGELAGVKVGDVVTRKGERYRVTKILSDNVPEKGLPILAGVKLLKNGKPVKSETTIRGPWKKETPVVTRDALVAVAPKRRGRPPKAALDVKTSRVSRRAALAAIAPEGTA